MTAADTAAPATPRGRRPRTPEPPPAGTVVDLYDVLRAARLNVLYYGRRLDRLQFWSLLSDVLIALGSASAFGALALWSSTGTKAVPLAFSAVAVSLAAVKPTLGLSGRIKRLAELWSGYQGVFQTADSVTRAVRSAHDMTADHVAVLATLHERLDALGRGDDVETSETTLLAIQARVEREFPVDDWWVPDEELAPTA